MLGFKRLIRWEIQYSVRGQLQGARTTPQPRKTLGADSSQCFQLPQLFASRSLLKPCATLPRHSSRTSRAHNDVYSGRQLYPANIESRIHQNQGTGLCSRVLPMLPFVLHQHDTRTPNSGQQGVATRAGPNLLLRANDHDGGL